MILGRRKVLSWRKVYGVATAGVQNYGSGRLAMMAAIKHTTTKTQSISSRFYSTEDHRSSFNFGNISEKLNELKNVAGVSKRALRQQYNEHYYQQYYQNLTKERSQRFKRYFSIILAAVVSWIVFSYVYNKQIKEFIARTLGNYITKNSRFTVIFEEASILPGWNKIYFKKCFISKRPKSAKKFVKGSQQDAIDNAVKEQESAVEDYDDGNYTQYDLTINEINMSISFTKWFNSKGILKDVEMKGVRGIIDRTHVNWDPNDDARNYLNVPSPGDFNIENFQIEDFLVTLYQPGGFRPFNISIFNCQLSKLRQNWFLLDFLSANNINGSYDGSLFTINKIFDQQKNDYFTRCRIDGLNVDHLNAGMDGPLGWIVKGTVDMCGDIRVPRNNHKVQEFFKLIKDEMAENIFGSDSANDVSEDYEREYKAYYHEDDKFGLRLRLQLNNVKAKIPLFTNELSYINFALMRPIVGYINSRQTFVAINCEVIKSMKDFNGSWTIYDSLLMDDISEKVYEEFGNYVIDEEQKSKRVKKIGFWALQIMLQVFLFGLSSIG
ncbi:Mdm31 protein [Saccharomycopsis crataegensis]|uniref:Mdm31 protein n=1 Tax=Saccharomycopsis crataegensis TaxID=43959 RepID=A0AAV5QEB3_9ASCO|nr:Mdm31 protein [Saccharomycopsis crataegensis]